tara:strand:- start:6307 stop:6735 length:429 start_codon:yes stop_codon:yes gene_type:complete
MNQDTKHYKLLIRKNSPSRPILMKLYNYQDHRVQRIKELYEQKDDCDWVCVFNNVDMADCDEGCNCSICVMTDSIKKDLPTVIDILLREIDQFEKQIDRLEWKIKKTNNQTIIKYFQKSIDHFEEKIMMNQISIKQIKGEIQ